MSAVELADRRQRALIAYYDACAHPDRVEGSAIALGEAIETASRVRITPELIEAAREQYEAGYRTIPIEQQRAALKAAFEAAGFEVEE